MFLSIKEMELRPLRFDTSLPPGGIDFSESGVRQSGDALARGTAELVPHGEGDVRIRGRVEARLETECDRCLAPTLFPVDSDFDLLYRPAATLAREEEIEIEDDETEIGFYEGAGLQLEDVLREQILLALPMQRVCREDCLGMCPVCGGNRNENPCQCHEASIDERWQQLKDIRKEV